MKNEETVVSRRTATVALRLCSVGRVAPVPAGQESTVQKSGGHRPPLQKTAAQQHDPALLVAAVQTAIKVDLNQFKPTIKKSNRNQANSNQKIGSGVSDTCLLPTASAISQQWPRRQPVAAPPANFYSTVWYPLPPQVKATVPIASRCQRYGEKNHRLDETQKTINSLANMQKWQRHGPSKTGKLYAPIKPTIWVAAPFDYDYEDENEEEKTRAS